VLQLPAEITTERTGLSVKLVVGEAIIFAQDPRTKKMKWTQNGHETIIAAFPFLDCTTNFHDSLLAYVMHDESLHRVYLQHIVGTKKASGMNPEQQHAFSSRLHQWMTNHFNQTKKRSSTDPLLNEYLLLVRIAAFS
jgi:hypothetical protein